MRSTLLLALLAMTLIAGLSHAFVAGGEQIAAGTYNMTGNYQGTDFSGTLTIDANGNGTSTVETPNWGTDTWTYNPNSGKYTITDDAGQGPWYMEFTSNGSGGYTGKYVSGPGRQVPRPYKKKINWIKLT